jgi:hypothetical protein
MAFDFAQHPETVGAPEAIGHFQERVPEATHTESPCRHAHAAADRVLRETSSRSTKQMIPELEACPVIVTGTGAKAGQPLRCV